MNHSSLTRKEQVLARLREHLGSWVDGNLIMTAECGGQRGGARVKDLRDDGYTIESRKHPDPKRDVWQYRLMAPPDKWKCSSCGNPLGAIPPSLTDKYANAYCRHCKGSRVFTP